MCMTLWVGEGAGVKEAVACARGPLSRDEVVMAAALAVCITLWLSDFRHEGQG